MRRLLHTTKFELGIGLLSLGLLVTGCANGKKSETAPESSSTPETSPPWPLPSETGSSPAKGKQRPKTLEIRDLAQGTSSGIRDSLRMVVRTREEWDKLWRRHISQRTPQPPSPKIDFDTEMVLVVTMGEQPTGGYRIRIAEVRTLPEKALEVTVAESTPPEGALTTQALTSPFHFAAVPITDLPVRFVPTKANDIEHDSGSFRK